MQTFRRRRARRGFTLIEIMVVVLIIGLLVTLVGPNVMRALSGGQQTKIKTDIQTLGSAIQIYKMEKHKYPDSLEELATPDESGNSFIQGNRVPKDPWGVEYFYNPPRGGSNEYEIGTYGRDGAPGGEGEDRDVTNLTLNEEND